MTTFHLPDFRRRVAVGAGGAATAALGSTVGSTGGAETETLTVAQIPSHSHGSGTPATALAGEHTHRFPVGTRPTGPRDIAWSVDVQEDLGRTSAAGDHTHSITGSTAETGGAGAHDNLPPSAVVTKLIKT